jgi:outer membrane lipoprotein-sorting protein
MQFRTIRLFRLAVILISTSLPLMAQNLDPELVAIDALVNFPDDFSAEYSVVQKKPGEDLRKTVSSVFRRDLRSQFLILIKEPQTDSGKGYLREGASLWLYDPKDAAFTMTSARDRFESSNARLSDFSGSSWAEDYRIANRHSDKLGRFDCIVYELTARSDQIGFPRSTN